MLPIAKFKYNRFINRTLAVAHLKLYWVYSQESQLTWYHYLFQPVLVLKKIHLRSIFLAYMPMYI
jgi:hypothetical protein